MVNNRGCDPAPQQKKGKITIKNPLYEVIFEVTETLQNGKERRVKKSVFMPHFDAKTGRHIPPEVQKARGEKALKEAHFYNIVYVETKNKTLIFG